MADLDSLAIFAKVMDAKGFSEAARRMKMSLSTVSRRIAELERKLGVRLIERSTRSLRLTDIGAEVLEHARRVAEIGDAVDLLISHKQEAVSGVLRLSAPPSISDSLVAPLVGAFQASYPGVRVQIFVTERHVDHITEGVDLVFRIGGKEDSTLVARKLLTYRHQLVASPAYLATVRAPQTPQDLLTHKLFAFSPWKPERTWIFTSAKGTKTQSIHFRPHLAMNDYAGLASALLAGAGIGDLPPVVQPNLMRDGKLVEVMPKWHFRTADLSLVHLGGPHLPHAVRVFKELAARMAPTLFPRLPA